jgi:hypothetical protein
MEEIFFFQYHMHLDMFTVMKYEVPERKWLIDRFIQQKNK